MIVLLLFVICCFVVYGLFCGLVVLRCWFVGYFVVLLLVCFIYLLSRGFVVVVCSRFTLFWLFILVFVCGLLLLGSCVCFGWIVFECGFDCLEMACVVVLRIRFCLLLSLGVLLFGLVVDCFCLVHNSVVCDLLFFWNLFLVCLLFVFYALMFVIDWLLFV